MSRGGNDVEIRKQSSWREGRKAGLTQRKNGGGDV